MRIMLSPQAEEDYLHWQEQDAALAARIDDLIRLCLHDPFRGAGKPQPLAGDLSGWWSRRINGEHRLVYRVGGEGETLEIAQCWHHYQVAVEATS